MIAVDTNVLLRYFMRDDPAQFRAARALFQSCDPDRPAFVAREVAVEFLWVLSTTYRTPRAGLIEAMENLLGLPLLRFEEVDTVGGCLMAMRKGTADFVDYMIRTAARGAGCETLYTFDRKLARHAGVALLEAS